jgi:hypothetical protein
MAVHIRFGVRVLPLLHDGSQRVAVMRKISRRLNVPKGA